MIVPLQRIEECLSLLAQSLILRRVFHLPGKEEIKPVDVGPKLGNIVSLYHLKVTGWPM